MQLLWFLIIGIAAGWLAGQLMKGGGYGLIGDLVIGVIGAFLGGWLFRTLGIVAGGLIGSPVTADHWAVVFAVSDPADQGVASPSPPRSTHLPTGDAEHNRRASSKKG